MNYLVWLLLFMGIPLLLLVIGLMVYLPRIIKDNVDVIWRSLTVLLVIGYVWDAYAVHEGWWFYESQQIIGVWVLGLPVEEYAFIVLTSLFYSMVTLVGLEVWGEEP